MTPLEELKLKRFQYLKALYEVTGGSSSTYIDTPYRLGESLGFSGEETARIDEYLRGEGLVERLGLAGETTITHYGIVEVEAALSQPQKPTEHFPPVVNIVNVHNMVGSAIQQGTDQSSQTVSFKQNQTEAVREFLAMLKHNLPQMAFPAETAADLQADIATVEAQFQSSRPKVNIVAESLHSIRTILEGAAGNLVAAGLLAPLTNLIQALAQ